MGGSGIDWRDLSSFINRHKAIYKMPFFSLAPSALALYYNYLPLTYLFASPPFHICIGFLINMYVFGALTAIRWSHSGANLKG